MKNPEEYKKMCDQLDKLIESARKDATRLKEKIETKRAEYEATNKILDESFQKKTFADNHYVMAMFNLEDAQVLTDVQIKYLTKRSDLWKGEIERDERVLSKMVENGRALVKLRNGCSPNDDASELENKFSQAKTQICSEENKDLFSKHSEGYDWFSKIVAFFNSVFTKTIGEKNIDKIEKSLDKVTSIAQKLSNQGFFSENRYNGNPDPSREYDPNDPYWKVHEFLN